MSFVKLWPEQQRAFEFATSRPKCALLCEQRTGKTFISLRLLQEELSQERERLCVVLICLLNNKISTWVTNLEKHLPEVALFESVDEFKAHKGAKILLIHFEMLARVVNQLCRVKSITRVIIDEAHRIYNRGSKQSKAAARLSWVEKKLILTGTPLEKKPTDLWAQFRFLAPEVLGTKYADFEASWLAWKKLDPSKIKARPGGPAWQRLMLKQRILKSKAVFIEEKLPQFIKLIEPYCFRLEKSDVGIVGPLVVTQSVKLSRRHTALYSKLEKHGVLELPTGETLMVGLPAVKIMKLRQVASGFIYDEEGELHWLSTRKIRRAVELFMDSSKPVVVFCSFIPEALEIHRRLTAEGYRVKLLTGRTPKHKKTRGAEGFPNRST